MIHKPGSVLRVPGVGDIPVEKPVVLESLPPPGVSAEEARKALLREYGEPTRNERKRS